MRTAISKSILFLLCAFVYLTLSLPWYIDAAVLMALAVTALRSTWGESLLILASLVAAATLAQIVFASEFLNLQLYYREHEKWIAGSRYKPNVTDKIAAPFGDMLAADPGLPASVIEPHPVEFFTDSLGYRNRADYAGQKAVLVGDSFVAGQGTDQSEILSELLTNEFAFPAYALAFPASPPEYETRAETFLPRLAPDASYAFMIFEGNDFVVDESVKVGLLFDRARARLLNTYLPFLRYPKYLFGMSRRAQAMLGFPTDTWIETYQIGSRPVAFARYYINTALHPAPRYEVAGNEHVLSRTGCVFFIPEKYRVYKEYIQDGRILSEPAAGLLALQKFYGPRGVPVVDLTPALREAARTLLKQDQYVFWRDDTHWNGNGMRAVAPVVRECLQARLAEAN
jgi:hypothetical protein